MIPLLERSEGSFECGIVVESKDRNFRSTLNNGLWPLLCADFGTDTAFRRLPKNWREALRAE